MKHFVCCLTKLSAILALALTPLVGECQQETIANSDLAAYVHFELRPVRSLTRVHPAVSNKFSAALNQHLQTYVARWSAANREGAKGPSLAFDVSITDAKFVSGQKRFWIGPIAGSSRMGAQVEFVDLASGEVVGRQVFRQAAGAMKGTFTMGATDNRMITLLAQQVANHIIGAYSRAPQGGVDSVATEVGVDEPPNEPNQYDELVELDDLRKRGIITEEEFNREKSEILNAPRN